MNLSEIENFCKALKINNQLIQIILSMESTKPIINTDQVLATIDQTLQEIREGLQPEKLSGTDRAELIEGFLKLEAQAHKCKLKLKIDDLIAERPLLSTQKAMVELLSTLPEDLPAHILADLAAFVATEWEKQAKAA